MRRLLASALSTTALAATAAIVTNGTAVAEPDWDELAQCESSGNWQSTAGHYEGGIQFDPNTWDAYGGEQYAPSANQATREQQIAVGRKVLADQGYSAWPGCSASTGWEAGGTSDSGQSARKETAEPSRESNRPAVRLESGRPSGYTVTVPRQSVPTLGKHAAVPPGGKLWPVVKGDTLSSIAARHGFDYKVLEELNPEVVEHPHWIFPGELLVIPAPTR